MAKQPNIEVILVRSGVTDWDEAGRIQGQTDLPLSQAGRNAVGAATQELTGSPAELVLSAPDEASLETAQVLASRLGAKVRKIEGLAETDLGLWEGLRERELTDRFPKTFQKWRENPTSVQAPQGDTVGESAQRILNALARALDRSGKGAIVVVLRPIAWGVVRCWAQDRPLEQLWVALRDNPPVDRLTLPREKLESLLRPGRQPAAR